MPNGTTSNSSLNEEKFGELAKTHEVNPAAVEMDTTTPSMPDEPLPLDQLLAITNLNKNLDNKFANRSTQIQKLQSDVTKTRTRLQTLETSINNHGNSRIAEQESLCSSLQADNKYMKAKLEDLESRSRCQNI